MSLKTVIDLRQITGAVLLFERFPDRLQEKLYVAMQRSEAELLKEIKDRVPVLTGTLRRSWNKFPITANTPLGWRGGAGSNLSYAAFQEFGFHGVEQVRAHTRLGRPVAAHQRNVSYTGRPYARPGLQAAAPAIQQHHVTAIRSAVMSLRPRDDSGRFA